MINLAKIDNDVIFISPDNKKHFLVKEYSKNYPSLHIKFMNKNEVIKGFYFTYNIAALYHLHNKYNLAYSNCDEILANLIKVKPLNEELNGLYRYYQELKDNNLLIENSLFKLLFNNKKVYIYGYSKHDVELLTTLKENNINFEFIEDEIKETYNHQVYMFSNIDDEVLYIFNQISSLIKNGVSQNNIYLYSYKSEYDLLIEKYKHYYNLNIETDDGITLNKIPLYKKYLSLLNNNDPKEAFEILKSENIYNSDLYLNKLAALLVEILSLNIKDINEFMDLLNYKASNTRINNIKYKEAIKICDNDSIITDSDYVFILGFSLDSFPLIYKDIDILSDSSKNLINKNTSTIKNMIEKEKIIKFIKNNKNLIITYKKKSGKSEYYPSLLIEELNMKVNEGIIDNQRYSLKYSQYEVGKYKDDYTNYGIKNEYYDSFSNDELEYKKYDHTYKSIPKDKLKNKVSLSFSSIDNYNLCHFKYFINKMLKITDFEPTLGNKLGKLFHHILENTLDNSYDYNNFVSYINENFTTNKERFFVSILIDQVVEVITKNKELHDNSLFKRIEAEKKLYYTPDDDNNAALYGEIDKIMLDDSNKNLILIDYKTYDLTYHPEKNKYGLDLQLPLYSLLLKNNYRHKMAGMYIQNIMINPHKENDKPYYLEGLTYNDLDLIKRIDGYIDRDDEEGNKIKTSKFIKGIKINKDGTLASYKGLVDDETINRMIENANIKFKEAVASIRDGDFKIAPTRYKKEKLPCDRCQFKDICFHTNEDILTVGAGEEREEDLHAI